ncbi:MAG TPA: DJ-1/PfpI family protein [Spirochaetota bacterium]|nr:DJ-1/PfpI family protein [Spirochaetota bacterium]
MCMTAYLYVLQTLSDWEIGYITAEMHSRRYFDTSKEPVPLVVVGSAREGVRTMGGITINPEERIDAVDFRDGDMLILPGADTWMERANRKVLDIVPGILEGGVTVAAICGATMALANAGVLDTRRHTSNDGDYLKAVCPAYSGSGFYVQEHAVTDGNVITATGLAPLEFSYEVFKKLAVMRTATLEAWYQLNSTREARYYFALMESLK